MFVCLCNLSENICICLGIHSFHQILKGSHDLAKIKNHLLWNCIKYKDECFLILSNGQLEANRRRQSFPKVPSQSYSRSLWVWKGDLRNTTNCLVCDHGGHDNEACQQLLTTGILIDNMLPGSELHHHVCTKTLLPIGCPSSAWGRQAKVGLLWETTDSFHSQPRTSDDPAELPFDREFPQHFPSFPPSLRVRLELRCDGSPTLLCIPFHFFS